MSPMGKSAYSALTVHEDLNDSTGIPEFRKSSFFPGGRKK